MKSAYGQLAAAAQPLIDPSQLAKFADPLPIPRKLAPIKAGEGITHYRVRMMEFHRKLHSQLAPTRLWGFEGQYPGPTFEAERNAAVSVQWENRLPAKHIFAVDPRLHGAMPPAAAVRTVTHLHGARSRSEYDGLPEKWFTTGESRTYIYPNSQRAATLWYHDHALGITRLNVYAGLSGFYLLRDDDEKNLKLPSGNYEVPLLLQDRSLDEAGQLVYTPTHEDGKPLPPGVWGPESFGNFPVVNGAIYPHLRVEPRRYRFRVLNGCNSRFFRIRFNLAANPYEVPDLMKFLQIGSDGGLLPSPAQLTSLLLGPAERADLLIDFTTFAGKTITLTNDAPGPFPYLGMEPRPDVARLPELMQFRVDLPLASVDRTSRGDWTFPFEKLSPTDTTPCRDLVLREYLDSVGHSLGVKINDKGYDEPVTETVKLGSVEKWRFINPTDDAHPMHLHLVQFQILERQGFDAAKLGEGIVRPIGIARVPAANEAGWKDTVVVNPGEMLTAIIRFDGFVGRYVFHCHMLEHEDNDMMRPYEVLA